MMSRSSITTEPRRLRNHHVGDILQTEFLEPLELSGVALANVINVEPRVIADILAGRRPMTADVDLRLGRYLGMSEGFFMRLQQRHDLMKAKRSLDGELDRIVPRAA